MKKVLLLLSLLSITGLAMSQDGNTRRWVEVDVSISPYGKPVFYEGNCMSAAAAVRYCFSDHFSAGLGVSPTALCYDYQDGHVDNIAYVPFFVSLRYEVDNTGKFSPYVIGDLAMSFMQLNDYAYQPRLGLGLSTWITPKTRMFAELGLAFLDDVYGLYAPLTVGFRF